MLDILNGYNDVQKPTWTSSSPAPPPRTSCDTLCYAPGIHVRSGTPFYRTLITAPAFTSHVRVFWEDRLRPTEQELREWNKAAQAFQQHTSWYTDATEAFRRGDHSARLMLLAKPALFSHLRTLSVSHHYLPNETSPEWTAWQDVSSAIDTSSIKKLHVTLESAHDTERAPGNLVTIDSGPQATLFGTPDSLSVRGTRWNGAVMRRCKQLSSITITIDGEQTEEDAAILFDVLGTNASTLTHMEINLPQSLKHPFHAPESIHNLSSLDTLEVNRACTNAAFANPNSLILPCNIRTLKVHCRPQRDLGSWMLPRRLVSIMQGLVAHRPVPTSLHTLVIDFLHELEIDELDLFYRLAFGLNASTEQIHMS
ncbi:hypothetical protein MRB53_038472 [Persea americana]|nr:hypothetical protein MRB53_038472 [Persea americana]